MQIKLDDDISYVLKTINDKEYEAYLVGGFVRDSLLGFSNDDYDICTNMPLDEIENTFNGFKMMRENERRQIGRLKLNNKELEFVYFKGKTLYDDLIKRDITINALACDYLGNVIDYVDGITDIKNKVISLVEKSGAGILKDPLRILRILRFSLKCNFIIDRNTKNIILKYKYLLNDIAHERTLDEFRKILSYRDATKIINEYIDIFSIIIPEFKRMNDFNQNNPNHIYTVLEHTLKVMDNVAINNFYLRVAALFHDIGKPFCYTEKDGVGHFYGHPKISSEIFLRFSDKYGLDKKSRDIIYKLIIYHDKDIPKKINKLNRFIYDYGKDNFDLLFLLKEADVMAQNNKYFDKLNILREEEKVVYERIANNFVFNVKDLKIDGRYLMSFGINGRDIGIVLNKILNLILDNQLENEKSVLENYVNRHFG